MRISRRNIKELNRDLKLLKKGTPEYNDKLSAVSAYWAEMADQTATMGLRLGVDKIIKPVTIKGTILKDDIDALIKTPLKRR